MTRPRLTRKLTLETKDRVPDGGGGFTEVWTPLGAHWAEVTSRAGAARAEAGVPVSAVSYRIVVRGSPPGSAARPMPGQRFREGQRIFAVIAVAEHDAAGMYLTCFAEEETVT